MWHSTCIPVQADLLTCYYPAFAKHIPVLDRHETRLHNASTVASASMQSHKALSSRIQRTIEGDVTSRSSRRCQGPSLGLCVDVCLKLRDVSLSTYLLLPHPLAPNIQHLGPVAATCSFTLEYYLCRFISSTPFSCSSTGSVTRLPHAGYSVNWELGVRGNTSV